MEVDPANETLSHGTLKVTMVSNLCFNHSYFEFNKAFAMSRVETNPHGESGISTITVKDSWKSAYFRKRFSGKVRTVSTHTAYERKRNAIKKLHREIPCLN